MSETVENVETDAPAGPDPAAADAPETNALSAVEDAARAGGWVPKGEFKGEADKWLDAPGFVLKAAEILPHVNQALREARGEIRDVKKTLAQFAEHNNKTEQRAYERALRDLQERIDSSAAAGDVQGVRDATDELVELQKDVERKPTAEAKAPPEFEAWQEANSWFGKDKALTAATIAIANEVLEEGYTGAAQVREVDKRIRAEFPQKFENPARKNAAAVEGAGSPPRKGGKTYSDLPSDAKAMCDDFVKRVPGFSREKYCKDYFGQ